MARRGFGGQSRPIRARKDASSKTMAECYVLSALSAALARYYRSEGVETMAEYHLCSNL